MRLFLVAKLREFASTLRQMSESMEIDALRIAKDQMLETIHRILVINMGVPPKSFDWSFRDKDGAFHQHIDQTPLGFWREHVPFSAEINDYVSLINDPRNAYASLFTVQYLASVKEAPGIRYVNVSTDDLRRYAAATITAGEPVWFGCDVGKEFHRKLSVMDTNLYDYESVYGTSPGMSKEDRLRYGESLMTHAMVFTAFDADARNAGAFTKWRVENSWGEEGADKGYYLMTDAWFEEYMYQIVVHKRVLDQALLPVLDSEPTALPPWDPMGSLATVRDDKASDDATLDEKESRL
jgi:bleomycin hydrolase